MNIKTLLASAKGKIEPKSAKWLLASCLGVSTSHLAAYPEQTVPAKLIQCYQAGLSRLTAGEPLAYVLGEQPFSDLMLMVTPDVLIPRIDTEVLLHQALALLPKNTKATLLELGTGSGALACALAKAHPNSTVLASDISCSALEIAKQNATKLKLNNLDFVQSDWYQGISNLLQFDCIVSNPPYIAEGDANLEASVKQHEPIGALISGPTGLEALSQIILTAPEYLKSNGCLLIEHGFQQQKAVQDLFQQAGFCEVKTVLDAQNHPRVTLGRKG